MLNSSVNHEELNKFEQCKDFWWDLKGPLKTLHAINPARLDFVLKHTNLLEKHILDIGCGGGVLTQSLANYSPYVVGIDAEASAISAAKKHAKLQKTKVEYLCTPVENFEHQEFDIITCMELLEHVDNPGIIFEHANRLLKPGGLLFISTINRNIKSYLGAIVCAEYILSLLPKRTHDYKKFLKPSEIFTLANEYEFSVIEYSGILYNPLINKAKLVANIDINYICVLQRK